MKKAVIIGVALIIAAVVVIVMMRGREAKDGGLVETVQTESSETSFEADEGDSAAAPAADEASGGEDVDADAGAEDEAEYPQTEEEKRDAEEEKKVNAFDDLTDKWMEPMEKGVTMADVENFAKHFRQVPKARQDECIHRALNLIPDENVMLLVGILMDKSMDKEIVETVFNDILNRDEDVKKPILKQIFNDKDHPCWSDVAWILDVTGELPSGKSK